MINSLSPKMALWKIITAVAIIATSINATPTIDYPFNSQVPTIARVSQPFAYTFPTSTFSSTFPITYNLSSGPSWLVLDSTSRTLSGTPSTGDVGQGVVTEVPIGLTATDSSGSITLYATLAVSKSPAPVMVIPPSAQLPSFGVFSGPSTILFHPSTPFSFKFDPGTFSTTGDNSNLSYYAVTSDNTPLPSWVLFDANSLTFSGQTPDYSSLIQPPQTFGIRLIVTDIASFAGASIVFYIEVGVHLLSFINADMFMNVTAGGNVSFDGLSNNIQIDGQLAKTSEISSITVQTPTWLMFDNSTMELTGIAPANIIPSSISVFVTDMYGDTANATILVAVSSSVFSMMISDLNTTAGSSFSYNLSAYLSNSSDIYMTANFTPSESWLSLDPLTFVLAGQVPTTAQPSTIGISLTGVSKSSHVSSSQSFKLSVISSRNPASSSPGSSSRTSTPSTASRTASLIQAADHQSHRLSNGIIAAIVTPILVVFAAVLIALYCYRRRRRATRRRPKTPPKAEISAPLEARERFSLSSVEEIVLPPRVAPPDPLQLDTSGFGDHTHHAITTNEKRMSPQKLPDRTLRRSRTTVSMSGGRMPEMTEPESSRNIVRSYSENALSKTNTSWRSTQESAYPTIRSSRTNSSHRLTRTYSNYSRKGRTRRSAQVPSTNLGEAVGGNTSSSAQQSEGSILNLKGSGFSLTPLENFSALSRSQSTQEEPKPAGIIERPIQRKPLKRNSKFGSTIDKTRSGIGHGRRTSISSFSSRSAKRRSVEHGQEWMASSSQSPALARNSRTWLTVASGEESNRQSNISALSEYSDTYAGSTKRMSIRKVPKSPSIGLSKRPSNSQGSQTSRNSRPVSRRIGSSPFFAGSSIRDSRYSPRRVRMSYADSPTVPEEAPVVGNLEDAVLHGLRDEQTPPRDSFGISYGLAREGTRQLKSFIQGQLHKTKTEDSIRSTQSKDSRFESAVPSMHSLHQSQHPPIPSQNDDDEYEDYIQDDFSEGSWETHPPSRDSQGNPIEYSGDESPQVSTAAKVAQAKSRASVVPSRKPDSKSFTDPAVNMGPGARMVPGVGRRPISVDAKATKGSVRAKVERHEGEYSAYI